MNNSTIHQDSRVYEAWKLFISKGSIRREVLRDKIVYSWARSRLSGLKPDQADFSLPYVHRNTQLRINHKIFDQVIHKYEMTFILVDSQGIVHDTFGHDLSGFAFDAGMLLDESKMGSWSIHYAMQNQEIERIIGAEHYLSMLHQYADFTLPISLQLETSYLLCVMPLSHYHHHIIREVEVLAEQLQIEASENNKVLQISDDMTHDHDFNKAVAIFEMDSVGTITAIEADQGMALKLSQNVFRLFPDLKMQAFFKGQIQMVAKENAGLMDAMVFVPVSAYGKTLKVIVLSFDQWNQSFRKFQGFRPIYRLSDLAGDSEAIKRVVKRLEDLSSTYHPVLIKGLKGTGKKVAANCIHSLSNRSDQPYLWLDCSKVHQGRLDHLLFGDKGKGSIGYVTMAAFGTLYLDHANQLLPETQKKIFNLIIEADQSEKSRCHTPKFVFGLTISHEISEPLLLDRLMRRLEMTTIEMPDFKSRQKDFEIIAEKYLSETGVHKKEVVFEEQLNLLKISGFSDNAYHFREMVNASIHNQLPLVNKAKALMAQKDKLKGDWAMDTFNLDEIECATIIRALLATDKQLTNAAKLMGIGRTTLYRKLEKYQIDVEKL